MFVRKKESTSASVHYKCHNFAFGDRSWCCTLDAAEEELQPAGLNEIESREASLLTAFKSSAVDNTIAGTVGTISSVVVAPMDSSCNEELPALGGNATEQEVGDTIADTKQVMRFFRRTNGQ